MAESFALLPTKISYVLGGTQPLLRFFLSPQQALGLDGLQLRVIVFDDNAYLRFRVQTLKRLEDFSKYNVAQTLNDLSADPPLEFEGEPTGVLLKFTGRVRHNRAGHSFDPALSKAQQLSDERGNLGFEVLSTTGVSSSNKQGTSAQRIVIANFGYSKALRAVMGELGKAISVAVVEVNETRGASRLRFSTLIEGDTPRRRPIPVDDAALNLPSAVIGGDGGQAPRQVPPGASRALTPDITGYYEALNDTDEKGDPPLLMDVNQAGHTIVGWMWKPLNTGNPSTDSRDDDVPPDRMIFIGAREPEGAATYAIRWKLAREPDPDDRDNPANQRDVLISEDPCTSNREPFSQADTEDVLREGHHWKYQVTKEDDLATKGFGTLTFDDSQQPHRLFLVMPRFKNGAFKKLEFEFELHVARTRQPWGALFAPTLNSELNRELRSALVARVMDPLPQVFWDRLRDCAAGQTIEKRDPNRTLHDLIREFLQNNDDNIRRRVESEIDDVLRAKMVLVRDAQAFEVRVQFQQFIAEEEFDGRNALEQLRLVAASAVDRVLNQARGETREQRLERLRLELDGFTAFGLLEGSDFAYKVSILTVDGKVLVFKGGTFRLTIEKFRVGNRDDPSQDIKIDDFGTNGVATFNGVMIGLSASFKGLDLGASDRSHRLLSWADLTAADFNGARFDMVGLDAGSVTAIGVGFTSFKTSLFRIHVKLEGNTSDSAFKRLFESTSITLAEIQTKTFNPKFPKNVIDAVKAARELEDRAQQKGAKRYKPKTKLAEASAILGFITSRNLAIKERPPPTAPPDPKQGALIDRWVRASFNRDSAVLTDEERIRFEQHLAEDRALMETEDATLATFGYASPEATKEHNQKLSNDRAQGMLFAIEQAMGQALLIPQASRSFEGLGEGPAIDAGGLTDPPDPVDGVFPEMSPEVKAKIKREMETGEWQLWRFVDVYLESKLVMRAIKK